MNTDYDRRPFAAGSLTGIRSWRIDADGATLTGVYHKHPWTPEENLADCCVRNHNGFAMSVCSEKDRAPRDHRPGISGCWCGYYAYFEAGNNSHHTRGTNVLGLIEGYGLMTVGDRGFRCEKARIVAFIDEADVLPLRVQIGRFAVGRIAQLLRLGRARWPETTVPQAVRAAYPDVPVYRSIGAALARHPLTPPERPVDRPMPGPGRAAA